MACGRSELLDRAAERLVLEHPEQWAGLTERVAELLVLMREMDEYAGAAGDLEPIGCVSVPLRYFVRLRVQLRGLGL